MAYLFRFDSTYGKTFMLLLYASYTSYIVLYCYIHTCTGEYKGDVNHCDTKEQVCLCIDNIKIPVFSYKEPFEIPWGKHKVEIVAETSGVFTTYNKAIGHLQSGAYKVVISAPPTIDSGPGQAKETEGSTKVPLFVYGTLRCILYILYIILCVMLHLTLFYTSYVILCCIGVNHQNYDPASMNIISNASCKYNAIFILLDLIHACILYHTMRT